MDAFSAGNEVANVLAAATRGMDHLGEPPAEPAEGNRREHLHYRAFHGLRVARDRANEARKAVEQLEQMGVE